MFPSTVLMHSSLDNDVQVSKTRKETKLRKDTIDNLEVMLIFINTST